MKDDIDTAIKLLAKRIDNNSSPDEALKFTQAALNLAHVVGTLACVPPSGIPAV